VSLKRTVAEFLSVEDGMSSARVVLAAGAVAISVLAAGAAQAMDHGDE